MKSLINSYLGSFSSAALHFLKKNLPFYLAFYMSDDLGFYPGHWEPCIVNILNFFLRLFYVVLKLVDVLSSKIEVGPKTNYVFGELRSQIILLSDFLFVSAQVHNLRELIYRIWSFFLWFFSSQSLLVTF